MKTTIRFDRLKKLANHLIKGNLCHEQFDFEKYNYSYNCKFKRNGCATVGCAIGECPFVFPKYWCFSKDDKQPKLRRLNNFGFTDSRLSGIKFFVLNQIQYCHLFIPNDQLRKYGGKKLGKKATPKMVGNNILAFIKKINSN